MASYMGEYDENIFINCPDDEDYEPLFKAIMFAVTVNEFIPICAKSKKGGDIRVSKICELITKCKYGIHDISKTEPDEDNNLPRFNMPFELGLFYGCQAYGNGNDKDFIVFDREEYRYEKFLSDIKVIDVEGRHPADIAIAPSDSNIVYAIDIGYDVYKSVDGGRTFTKIVNIREDVLKVIL